MTSVLSFVHEWLGYLVFVATLGAALLAFGRGRDGREFRPGPFVVVVVALDVQVVLGAVQYVLAGAWDARPEVAYIHPLLAVVALGVAHTALRRARGETMAADANRAAGRGLLTTLLLIVVAIGVASAPPFL